MGRQTYLIINQKTFPLPTFYKLSYRDIEADSGGETEAGTIQRDVIRTGVVTISVSFNCSPKWVKQISAFKNSAVLNVKYLDTESLEMKNTNMFLQDLSIQLVKDTSYFGLWEGSFQLQEY